MNKSSYLAGLMLILLLSLQACSGTPDVRTNASAGIGVRANSLETDSRLANKIGQAELLTRVKADSDIESNIEYYRVMGNYTAASGRQCREVEQVNKDQEKRMRILCKTEDGVWYWPREIILK